MTKYKILILSVGSLLGQNILDTLEGRRKELLIIGSNTTCDNPRILRCDKVFKSPLTSSPSFENFVKTLIENENPDIVLPARDHDVLFLAEFILKFPEFKAKIPCGSVEAIKIMNDKSLSYLFAKKHGLPFAETFFVSKNNFEAARSWALQIGYPVLAKPREGFGSLGIRIICDEEQLEAFVKNDDEGFLLQEIIDFKAKQHDAILEVRRNLDKGLPLFFHMPDEDQYAAQAIIAPDGTVGRVFTSKSLMVIGRCERAQPCEDVRLEAVARCFAEAISVEGWRGVFNFQCRKTEDGYKGIEMNGRMSGSTSARLWLGFDEPRELIKAFQGIDIGPDARIFEDKQGVVYRSLTDYFVAEKDCEQFERNGKWEKNYET
ncbi:MAG: hypothetical protein WCQ41_01310 [Bacillota bacterium]